MKVTYSLATAGLVLLYVQLVNAFGPDTILPLQLGLICLAGAALSGLAKGPTAVRRSVILGLGSLISLYAALQLIHEPRVLVTNYVAVAATYPTRSDVVLFVSFALFVLAFAQSIVAVFESWISRR